MIYRYIICGCVPTFFRGSMHPFDIQCTPSIDVPFTSHIDLDAFEYMARSHTNATTDVGQLVHFL